MAVLKPITAAAMADHVYELSRIPKEDVAIKRIEDLYKGKMSLLTDDIIKGKTGGPGFVKVETAFGMILEGKTAPFTNNLYIVIRGTQLLADWLTNFNVGLTRSDSGYLVHDGFYRTFKTMLPYFKDVVQKYASKNYTIHCIGHSLGGALAQLCTDWVLSNTNATVYHYSFGAPRLGLQPFAEYIARELHSGDKNQTRAFRVYHKTDPVPMIPVWPFCHAPYGKRDYLLYSPGEFFDPAYHSMRDGTIGYIPSIGRGKDWDDLAIYKAPEKNNKEIEAFLNSKTILGKTVKGIEMINAAIIYVLKKCLILIGKTISYLLIAGATASFTIIDRIAMIIKKGIDISEKVGDWVFLLMRKIAEFLGMGKCVDKAQLTKNVITRLFTMLESKLQEMAMAALRPALHHKV